MSGDRSEKHGSCLCGAVRYRVTGPMRQVVACHCGQCRKQTGHYLAATGVRMKYFEMVEERALKWYRASDLAQRGFCGECGSTLFWRPDSADRIAIAAGSLDGETGLATAAHIFVADKGDYDQLDDDLPQYDQGGGQVPLPD
ncbi:MAG: GFA family protein [Alphaproteobacteria bacterium]|nr:GFA family protein [Alphaproteobacteria bacterium]